MAFQQHGYIIAPAGGASTSNEVRILSGLKPSDPVAFSVDLKFTRTAAPLANQDLAEVLWKSFLDDAIASGWLIDWHRTQSETI